MKRILHNAWQHIFITGICSLAFGIISLAWPAIPLYTLSWLFAAFMIAQGFFIVSGSLRTRDDESRWWLLMLYGILCILAGITALIYPGLTTMILGIIISLTFIIGGIIQIVMAIYLRKEIRGEGWLILSGLFTLIAGIYLILVPGGGALAMLWVIAVAAVILGILFILLAFRAKSWFAKMQKT